MKTIIRLSIGQAEAFIPKPGDACLSIMNPDENAKLSSDWTALVRVYFHDAEYSLESLWNDCGTGRPMYPDYHGFVLPSHARQIQKVVHEWMNDPQISRLIIHCHAGVSRSGAVCAYISEKYMGSNLEQGYPPSPNKTVLNLLRNPMHYGHLPKMPFKKRLLNYFFGQ